MSAAMAAQAARHFFHHLNLWPADLFEELLASRYRRFVAAGEAVIDVGAHVGRHTVQFAELVGAEGQVFAFEPIPTIFEKLVEQTAKYPWVKCSQVVLNNTSGDVEFCYVPALPGESGLVQRLSFDIEDVEVSPITVASHRLDDLYPTAPDRLSFIKIDVEGAELNVLEGAQNLILASRPIISAEWGVSAYGAYGRQWNDLYERARSFSYTIVDLFGFPVIGLDMWREVSDKAGWDFFLVPDEKLGKFLHGVYA